MKLHTQCYLPAPSRPPDDTIISLPHILKGLTRILLGYLLSLGVILTAGGFVLYLLVQAEEAPMSRTALKVDSTLLFAVALFAGLAGCGSLTLIVRGKWLCLAAAPEQFHAKWMVFLSILCILASPLLNAGVYLVGDSKPQARSRTGKTPSLARLQQEFEEYKYGFGELDTRECVKLAGKAIGLLSGVFFVLFLRALALCLCAPIRARLSELYLLFVALLAFGVFVLIRNPDFMLARPRLLLGLGTGWLIAGLWYFGLIVSMSACISNSLARPSRQPESVPAAPVSSSLPPLPEMTIGK